MMRFNKLFQLIAILIVSGFLCYQSAYGWDIVAQKYETFVIGQAVNDEESVLYTVDPVTGQLTMIGDTGAQQLQRYSF